jgi:hypothetical protein
VRDEHDRLFGVADLVRGGSAALSAPPVRPGRARWSATTTPVQSKTGSSVTRRMRPRGTVERTVRPCSRPGILMSST